MLDFEGDGFEGDGAARRRRADAERNIEKIVEAAIVVLGDRPDASIGDIARAADVTRPTVYAHFSSRVALLSAAIDRVSADAVAAMDAADLDHGPPAAALQRFLAVGWRTLERYPLLLRTVTLPDVPEFGGDRHEPVRERLERLIKRGQRSGDFDPHTSPAWLAAVTIGLGHTAGEQVATGQLTAEEAAANLSNTLLRACGVDRHLLDSQGTGNGS